MNRLALKLAVVAAVAGTAGMAKAADLPVKAPPPTAIVQANWNGLYVGAHVGWGRTTADGTSDFLDPSSAPPGAANPQANKLHKSSVIGGAHIGYNWQPTSQILLGIENDWTWVGTRYSFCRQTDTTSAPCVDNNDGFLTIGSKLEWMTTIRGRLGLVFGNILLYGTGGAAVGSFKTTIEQNCLVLGCGLTSAVRLDQTGTFRDYRVGWVAGGGFEWMMAPHWLFRTEYLHADFGTLTNSFATNGAGGTVQTAVWSRKETIDMVRAGVSYLFN